MLNIVREMNLYCQSRAGSRIFRRGDVDPFLGGFGFQRGHFSVKMYAKTKELGPVGGRVLACPPRSAYAKFFAYVTVWLLIKIRMAGKIKRDMAGDQGIETVPT